MIRLVMKPNKNHSMVELASVSASKIYAINTAYSTYKLQCINDKWAFCDLKDSISVGFGVWSSKVEAITAATDEDVYQFDTVEEFLTWV